MKDDQINKELLSALADGELQGQELEQALECAESAQGCESWEIYHLIGDVLRSPDLAHHSQNNLLTGLREKLRQEQPLASNFELSELKPVAPESLNAARVVTMRDSAANQSVFKWKIAAGFASVAAVAALGWNLLSHVGADGGAQYAQGLVDGNSSVLVSTNEGDVLRDPRLDALLANHQQYASRASLQAPAEFLRNASFAARSEAKSSE